VNPGTLIAIHGWLGRVDDDEEESMVEEGGGWVVGTVCDVGLCGLVLLHHK
jgi:hypothetical protein